MIGEQTRGNELYAETSTGRPERAFMYSSEAPTRDPVSLAISQCNGGKTARTIFVSLSFLRGVSHQDRYNIIVGYLKNAGAGAAGVHDTLGSTETPYTSFPAAGARGGGGGGGREIDVNMMPKRLRDILTHNSEYLA
jgi:hypothetical protein